MLNMAVPSNGLLDFFYRADTLLLVLQYRYIVYIVLITIYSGNEHEKQNFGRRSLSKL